MCKVNKKNLKRNTNSKNVKPHIFEIWDIDLPKYNDERDRHIQTGIRPCILISNDRNNTYSPNVTIIPITSQSKSLLPTHIYFNNTLAQRYGLQKESTVLCEGMTHVSKKRLLKKRGEVYDPKVILALYKGILTQITNNSISTKILGSLLNLNSN